MYACVCSKESQQKCVCEAKSHNRMNVCVCEGEGLEFIASGTLSLSLSSNDFEIFF